MNFAEIMTVTKHNRPDDLKEWVDYHLAIGFDKITIFDNNSTFSVAEFLKDYKKVEVQSIPNPIFDGHWSGDMSKSIMMRTYSSFCNERKGHTKWLCVIDDDEYLYINNGKTLHDLLDDKYPIIGIWWKMISLPYVLEDRTTTMAMTFNHVAVMNTVWEGRTFYRSILNLDKCNDIFWTTLHLPFINGQNYVVAYVELEKGGRQAYFSDKIMLMPNFYNNQSAVLYHYFHKSWKDWQYKVNRAGLDLNGKPCRAPDRQTFECDIINRYPIVDNSVKELICSISA